MRDYLWRAVDHEGEVLEVFATKRRDRRAALKFLKRTIKRYGEPQSIVTDRLGSYRATLKVIGNEFCQETRRWLNNRAENSHQPFRRRGRGNGAVQGHQDPAEIRRRPYLDPQPLRPRTPSQAPRHFQTRPTRRPGRLASTCSLTVQDCRFHRCEPVSLTMHRFHARTTQCTDFMPEPQPSPLWPAGAVCRRGLDRAEVTGIVGALPQDRGAIGCATGLDTEEPVSITVDPCEAFARTPGGGQRAGHNDCDDGRLHPSRC